MLPSAVPHRLRGKNLKEMLGKRRKRRCSGGSQRNRPVLPKPKPFVKLAEMRNEIENDRWR
jgi:hypothetical protein